MVKHKSSIESKGEGGIKDYYCPLAWELEKQMQRQNATQRRALAMVIGEDEKGANIVHLDRSLVENQDHAGQHPHFDVF